jgi:quinoprotein glucose dehydrogenase
LQDQTTPSAQPAFEQQKKHACRNAIARGALLALSLISLDIGATHAAETFTDKRQMGTKYSPLTQINASNVANLQQAWEYHTGEVSHDSKVLDAFEDEPSLIDGNLVVCTTSRRLIALDPVTGKQRWVYDPKSKATGMKKCRGISAWTDDTAPVGAMCKTRLFLGTADYRLVAVDSKSGKLCPEFGDHGQVQMKPTKPEIWPGEVSANSRPAVVNGVVVVGSTVADDQRLDAPSGRVIAFDARSGKQVWEFDPIPRNPADPAMATWLKSNERFGSGNIWAEMAVDEKLDLVYLPTSSPSVDFYGADRPGNNEYADSIVALKGSTGEVVWHFQFTHHNLWDYDTPSQPLLMDLPYNGKMVPALVQLLKTGMIFVFNRATGEPLVPYVERPVPQTGAVPGEWLSPTQPFPVGMPVLADWTTDPEHDAWGFTPIDRYLCKQRMAELEHGGIYTPPSLKGTILQPGAAGGTDWGGGAFDPKTNIMVAPSNRVPMVVTLVPRETVTINKDQAIETGKPMLFPNEGVKYVTKMEPLLSPLGTPCTAPPWAKLTAIDMTSGKIVWEVPLGSIEKLAHLPFSWELGTPGAGGPLITAGGVTFIGYTLDDQFRAFDLKTGKTLWKTSLPAAGMATPMSYEINGEQYVVIPAGGHSMYGSSKGDSVMAYKLKH